MRLFTDPQPAIEWFCTGGSVCIGVEGLEERLEFEAIRDVRVPAARKPKTPVRFPAAGGEA